MSENLTQKFKESFESIFPNTCLYRLADIKEGKKNEGAYSISKSDILKWNSEKYKKGIFFTPNGEYALSDGVRKKESAQGIFCFFAEKDTQDEFWKDFPLEPTIINKTKRGHHCYRVLKETLYDVSLFDKIQTQICELLGTDKNAKDVARVMRFPGTIYWKDNEGKFRVETILLNNNRYDIMDFQSLGIAEANMKIEERALKKELGDSARIMEDINAMVNVVDVLHDLGGSKREVLSSGSIKEGGETTSGYKHNKVKNYLNSDFSGKDRPKGGPFSVAKWFLKTPTETFKYFREKWNIGEIKRTEIIIEEKVEETGQKKQIKIKTVKGEIIIDHEKCLILDIVGNEERIIMDGVIEPIGFYLDQKQTKNYIVMYKDNKGNEGYFDVKELGKAGELEKVLSRIGITFFGGKGALKNIISYIHTANDKYEYINKLGLYSKDLIIIKVGKYIHKAGDKKYFVDINGITLDNENVIDIGQDVTLEDVKENLYKLKKSYDDTIVSTLFISFAMSLFSKHVRDIFRFYPNTTLVGLTQSGKTFTRRTLMDIFGLSKSLEIQASSTEFVCMKRSQHYFPMNVTEYMNTELKFDWDSFIRNNFDGSPNERGRNDLSSTMFENNSPIIMDGESRSTTNSVYSRSICLFMNPSYRKGHQFGYYNINKYFIDNFDNIYKIKECFQEQMAFVKDTLKAVTKQEKDRVIEIYSLLLAFAQCFGLLDIVKEDIMGQCMTQMQMMGEDNVDRTIKSIMALALQYKFNCEFDDEKKELKIDFLVDELRIASDKIKDMESNIQITNHHFSRGQRNSTRDCLYIPIDYIFKNNDLHLMFNRLLNQLVHTTNLSHNTIVALVAYSKANSYTKQFYYDYLASMPEYTHSDLFRENKNEKAPRSYVETENDR